MPVRFKVESRVAFRVTVVPSLIELSRLIEAMFKTDAMLSHAEIVDKKTWEAIIWIRVSSAPKFEMIARPKSFEFVASEFVVPKSISRA
jgi:hypothetical protein